MAAAERNAVPHGDVKSVRTFVAQAKREARRAIAIVLGEVAADAR